MTPPLPTRRPALARDLSALLEIHEAAFRELVEARFDWDPQLQRELFSEALLGEVLEIEGRVIGQWLVERRDDAIFLSRVMLHPDWQGRGIASALIRALQAEALAANLPLTLQVWEENPARALYERLGFVEAGAREFRVQMHWGT